MPPDGAPARSDNRPRQIFIRLILPPDSLAKSFPPGSPGQKIHRRASSALLFKGAGAPGAWTTTAPPKRVRGTPDARRVRSLVRKW